MCVCVRERGRVWGSERGEGGWRRMYCQCRHILHTGIQPCAVFVSEEVCVCLCVCECVCVCVCVLYNM